jgi:transcriptional regulator with XRE-family HTH domain
VKLEEVIGDRIAVVRTERGMSQAELGAALAEHLDRPWSRQAVYTAEKGKRAFTAAELVALALVLEIEVPELMTPDIRRMNEIIELPSSALPAKRLTELVAPEAPETWERRANMRTVADITPMLGGVIQTLQILKISLDAIQNGMEDEASPEELDEVSEDAKRHIESRKQLVAAISDMISGAKDDQEHRAAVERARMAIEVATGNVTVRRVQE